MSEVSERTAKVFSVEDANRTLPLVRAIVSDLVSLSREVAERRGRLDDLKSRRADDFESGDVYRAELTEVERDLSRDSRRIREYLEELRQLGMEARGEDEVDFPSVLDGRPIMLSWKLGESEVLYWHEVDSSKEERQPLMIGNV